LPYKNSLATRIRPAFSVISYEIVITNLSSLSLFGGTTGTSGTIII
jgi:hypothetical protein